jgi:arylsulfatase A-like enzyme
MAALSSARRVAILAAALVVLGIVVVAVVAARGREPSSHSDDPRPNILVVITDDQRATGTLGVMPQTRAWFADRGVSFAHAYVTTPLCCPSRASISTGQYVHNHGIVQTWDEDRASHFEAAAVERHLDEARYTTAIFGKYLVGWPIDRDPPHFDEWAITRVPHGVPYSRGQINDNGDSERLDEYQTDYVRDRALDFLDDAADEGEPWFLYLGFKAPHAPYTPSDDYEAASVAPAEPDPAMVEVDLTDKPPYVRRLAVDPTSVRAGEADDLREKQLRTLMSVDDALGEIFRELVRLGEDGNTLVIFTSDNGFTWGEHGLVGKKLVPYLPSVAVPLLASWPGHFEPGTVERRIVANIDIAPTVLEAAGIRSATREDGRSLTSARRKRLLLEYWSAGTVPTWASTLTAKYQYVEYYDRAGDVSFREYYRLASDPWELTNLLGDGVPDNNPDLAALSRRLATDRGCAGANCP